MVSGAVMTKVGTDRLAALALAIELIYQGAVSVLRGARVRGCAWQMPSRCTGRSVN